MVAFTEWFLINYFLQCPWRYHLQHLARSIALQGTSITDISLLLWYSEQVSIDPIWYYELSLELSGAADPI